MAQLKDAYTKLFEDYNELKEERKKREVTFFIFIVNEDLTVEKSEPGVFDCCHLVLQAQLVEKEVMDELQVRLTTAEEALAAKQERIDSMKQEIFQKEKELETISVFQAQVSV